MRKREKEIQKKLDEIGKKENDATKEIEKWYKERRAEMKGWREEHVRLIWERKQKGEKGRGWLTFGGGRKEKKTQVSGEGLGSNEKSGW